LKSGEMTSPRPRPMSFEATYELADNVDYGTHQQVLEWLAKHYAGPL